MRLEGNNLDVHVAMALGTMIRENQTLRMLHIKMNPIGTEGVRGQSYSGSVSHGWFTREWNPRT